MAIAQRAARTRFTAQMDERILAKQRSFARRRNRRRGDVEGAIDELAQQLALPKAAVKGRWYALARNARPPAAIAGARASASAAAADTAARPAAPPAPQRAPETSGTPRGPSIPSLTARYQQALARLDARQTEVARAQAAVAKAAAALAVGLRRR